MARLAPTIDFYRNNSKIKWMVLAVSISISAGSIYYTENLVSQLKEREKQQVVLFAMAIESTINEDVSTNILITGEILTKTSIPTILVDEKDSILYARNIDIDSSKNQASIDYAKKNGIADASKDAKCLKCHSTYDAVAANLRSGILATEGVSCESCHGPGSAYKSPTIMKNQKLSLQNGLILPDEKVCKTCHNPENPFHKEFVYATYVAKIAHPNPAAVKK